MQAKPRVSRTCEWCGGAFLAEGRDVARGRARFCSKRCSGAARHDGAMIPRVCEHCGAEFRAPAKDVRRDKYKFCSKRCGGLHQAPPLRERFEQRIDRGTSPDACWQWTGLLDIGGYGTIAGWRAHRLAWTFAYGEIPDGLLVCHRCDNPSCVRPDHLFLGDYQDNIDDCIEKERLPRGEQRAMAKLTESDVRTMRSAAAEGRTLTSLAEQFHVNLTTVHDVVRRNTWKHVS